MATLLRPHLSFDMWLDGFVARTPSGSSHLAKLRSLGLTSRIFNACDDPVSLEDELAREGIPVFLARDVVSAAMKFFKEQEGRSKAPVGVFWDFENLTIPSTVTPSDAVKFIHAELAKRYGPIEVFRAYGSVAHTGALQTDVVKSDFGAAGVEILDTPHLNRKEVADKMLIVDVMYFAMSRLADSPTVCIITSDADFSYTLSKLRDLNIHTVLISKQASASILTDTAADRLQWETLMRLTPRASPPRQQRNLTPGRRTTPHRAPSTSPGRGLSDTQPPPRGARPVTPQRTLQS